MKTETETGGRVTPRLRTQSWPGWRGLVRASTFKFGGLPHTPRTCKTLATSRGMIMEEMRIIVLSIPAMRGHKRCNAISAINAATAHITAIAQAAKALQS